MRLLQNRVFVVVLTMVVVGAVFVLVFTPDKSADNATRRNQVVEPINAEPPVEVTVEPNFEHLTEAELDFLTTLGNDEDGGILNDPEYIQEQKELADHK